ncbi:MAG: hypothetical protein NTY61_02100 [Candidatus Parcubacteria bacterium]|nr:hypothetical protein [Candidatus Parcubacteria bacterium]
MAREEIIEKLNRFLTSHNPLTEECHAVYLMVEIRKILDHERGNNSSKDFTLLRFYCDWTVHTEKTRITDNMRTIMEYVFQDIEAQIKNPAMVQAMSPVMQFAYMDKLKDEMKRFLEDHNVNTALANDGLLSFIKFLVKVLENQPIKHPTEDIELFSFLQAADGCINGIVKFKQPINGYDHYTFANAY